MYIKRSCKGEGYWFSAWPKYGAPFQRY